MSGPRPIGLITHPDCLSHDNGPGHPESRVRIDAIRARLETDIVQPGLGAWIEAPLVHDGDVLRVHVPQHLARLIRTDAAGGGWLDPDTRLGPGSLAAVRRAAGAAVLGAERALRGDGPSFSLVRRRATTRRRPARWASAR